MEKTTLSPVSLSERYVSLDVLRGFAVLGILVMNIQSFSMPGAAYMNPAAYGDLSGINKWAWILSHLLADSKFISIFSLLFGAGVILFYEKAKEKGRNATPYHFRRMFWLLLFGLIHAYLLWYGDILVNYALCGMIVFLFRDTSKRWLLIASALFFLVPVLTITGSGAMIQMWPEEAYKGNLESWAPSATTIANEIQAVKGGFMEQLELRAGKTLFMQTFLFFYSIMWRTLSMMLLGMWLYRSGILTLQRSASFYARFSIISLAVGYPLIALGVYWNFKAGWFMDYSMFTGTLPNYFGSVLVALGYIGLIMWICKMNTAKRFIRWMSAAGRMAFSNYILETVICTILFTGLGFGLFGEVERSIQVLIVFGIWILVIAFSAWWLPRYRFGPLEWLWRSLTYWKRQAMQPDKDN